MKITISTLFFYNPDLCKEFISEILPSVVEHADRGIDSVEFVISDNTPESESILKEIAPRLESLHSPTLRFTLHHNEYNNGFGGSHNRVFQESESDIFIVLNNDLFFKKTSKEPNWIEVLCAPLRAENSIAIVGVVSSPSVINDEGEGRWLETKTQVPDYAEGSILAIRSHVAKRLGLFATDLGIAYFEDSDLSLRFRQAGYQLAFVEIPHEHRRGSSSKILDPDLLTSIRAKNKTRFLTRWKQ
jgi:GT2 family glycosyltransferase